MNIRKPLAIANWKMAMTIAESLAFVRDLHAALGRLAEEVDVILCPPYTALHATSQALAGTPLQLGAQDLHAAPGKAHTGAVSASLLADAGCEWVLAGHWEIRRRLGESDADVNAKLHAAFRAGLRPILLIGEAASEKDEARQVLDRRLPTILAGLEAEQVAAMAVVYEPEWTIGVREPAAPETVTAGCSHVRRWIGRRHGDDAARSVRVIHGGSVTPAHAGALLASPEVDGLGASRKGRDPATFARIVELIAQAKRR